MKREQTFYTRLDKLEQLALQSAKTKQVSKDISLLAAGLEEEYDAALGEENELDEDVTEKEEIDIRRQMMIMDKLRAYTIVIDLAEQNITEKDEDTYLSWLEQIAALRIVVKDLEL